MDAVPAGQYNWGPFKPRYGYKLPVKYDEELKRLTDVSLAFYNSTHQRQFKLVEPLYLNFVTGLMDFVPGYDHLSFIARAVDPPYKLKLFFAEVQSVETEETYIPYVMCCTPVDPGTPFFPLGCGSCHPHGVIYHPFRAYNVGGSHDSSRPYRPLKPVEESAKELLWKKYTFIPSNFFLLPDEDTDFRKIVDGYARNALDCYKIGKGCALEFVKVVKAVRFHDSGAQCLEDAEAWVHMLFLAKDTLPAAPTYLFFAEYSIDYDWVTTCDWVPTCDMPSSALVSNVETSCTICRQACPMFHPNGEYYAGIRGGTFVDALDEQRSWGVRVYLEEKQPHVATQPGLCIMEQ